MYHKYLLVLLMMPVLVNMVNMTINKQHNTTGCIFFCRIHFFSCIFITFLKGWASVPSAGKPFTGQNENTFTIKIYIVEITCLVEIFNMSCLIETLLEFTERHSIIFLFIFLQECNILKQMQRFFDMFQEMQHFPTLQTHMHNWMQLHFQSLLLQRMSAG